VGYHDSAVFLRPPLKAALKRGALIAAANWPVTLIQAVADSLFKLLIAAPLVGGIFLVALVVGADPRVLLSLEWRDLAATIVGSLQSHPLVLTAFLSALAVVIAGGSVFVFLVKGGTVAVLVRGEREAGPVEQPPLHHDVVARASRFGVEFFIDAARALFARYLRLGIVLLVAYLASGAVYFATIYAGLVENSWAATALLTAGFVGWITLVNLLYLLMQIVIAADDCHVAAAGSRVLAFLRHDWRSVGMVFLVVLGLVVTTTAASVLATAVLGLLGFVPILGQILSLAVVPLAWVLREIVFQFIGLASIGAYVKLYRAFAAEPSRRRLLSELPANLREANAFGPPPRA
jgi:hypothetical protein